MLIQPVIEAWQNKLSNQVMFNKTPQTKVSKHKLNPNVMKTVESLSGGGAWSWKQHGYHYDGQGEEGEEGRGGQ